MDFKIEIELNYFKSCVATTCHKGGGSQQLAWGHLKQVVNY